MPKRSPLQDLAWEHNRLRGSIRFCIAIMTAIASARWTSKATRFRIQKAVMALREIEDCMYIDYRVQQTRLYRESTEKEKTK